ncbi:MAG: N-6 DNA methylase [Verrucomicrobia bacterium]|nr:N-6 DNA methylase [Verrucomicrobiota bacterium]
MRVNEGQSFLDLYFEPGAVEIATGNVHHVLFDGRGADVRNSGQVSTPLEIADAMAAWVMRPSPKEVLDPAAGFGHLLHACRRVNQSFRPVGIETDQEVFKTALATAPEGTKLVLSDYLRNRPGLFQGIIANPPYVKSQRMALSEAEWQYFDELFGTKLGRQTNLYALFLLKIWEDLAPKGRAAVIVPAEFLNANFGGVIKERLQMMRPRGLAVFASDVNLFENTLTTSVVLFLEKGHAPTLAFRGRCVRSALDLTDFVASIEKKLPVQADELDLNAFAPEDKWLNRLFARNEVHNASMPVVARIGEFFKCSRGIATGANDYFCLSASEIREHGLSTRDFDRCVTRATDLSGWLVDAKDFLTLVKAEKRCYLLNPRSVHPAMEAYIARGMAVGVHQRHLPSKRPVWYLPERRKQPSILVPVFSRRQPRFILNSAGVSSLTCFHGLYAKPGSEHLVPLAWVFLNSSQGLGAFGDVNRFYGNGLNKLEPKDVEQMACPNLSLVTTKALQRLTRQINDAVVSSELSASWFDRVLSDYLPISVPA